MYFKTSFSTVKKPPVTQLGGGKQEKAEMEFSTHAGVENPISGFSCFFRTSGWNKTPAISLMAGGLLQPEVPKKQEEREKHENLKFLKKSHEMKWGLSIFFT